MKSAQPTTDELKKFVIARGKFMAEQRDLELVARTESEVVAAILALDGLVAMSSAQQPDRIESGLQVQQALFRRMRNAR